MKYNITTKPQGRCMGYKLTNSFRPFGIPALSRYEGFSYLGAELPNLGLKVDQFVDALAGMLNWGGAPP